MSRITTDQLRHAVLDRGSFVSWDSEPLAVPVADSYARELAAARAATGADESVQTGEGRVFGRRVAVVACEFDFLGGSIGVAAAERITAAVERATAERLPLLASPSSGGTRMQEGTVAFLQMVKIAAAIQLHNQARLPYLVYLRHPTTGGVFASWGSLGHLTVAEPGALIGFLGPRVYELLYGDPFPSGVQTAENLRRHGIIDGVVALDRLRPMLDRALTVLIDAPEPLPAPQTPAPVPDVPTWDSVVASRRPDRPGVRQLLRHGATDRVLLSGTDQGEAATTLLALARFGGQPTVVLGQQRAVGGVVGTQPGGYHVEDLAFQNRAFAADTLLGYVEHPVQPYPAFSALVVPSARTDSHPVPVGSMALLAGHQQPQQNAAVSAHDEHGSVFAAGGVLLVGHPSPHDLAGIGPAIEVRGVDKSAGSRCGGTAGAGHRPARGNFGRWRRHGGGHDVRGDLDGLPDCAKRFLRVLQVTHQLRSLSEHQVLREALQRFPL